MFRNDSHIGRGFNKIESATRGNQVFKWNRDGDEWTFTATVIGLDYEDEINCEYLPFFEITDEDYKAISEAISEPEIEEDNGREKDNNYAVSRYELFDGFNLEIVEISEEVGIMREAWLCSETVKKFLFGANDHQTIYGVETIISHEEFIDQALSQIDIDINIFKEEEEVIEEYWNR